MSAWTTLSTQVLPIRLLANVLVAVALIAGPAAARSAPSALRPDAPCPALAAVPAGAHAVIDDNGGSAASMGPSVVERTFDSLSRVLEERQNGKAISSTYAGDGKRTSVTYPGGRTVGYVHDALDRVQRINDGVGPGAGLIAEYGWIGPGYRPLFRLSGNGTTLTMLDDLGQADVGYDSVQRVTRLRHLLPSGQAFVDRQHGYDRASNRTFEQRLDEGGLTDRYLYDSTYRVTSSFFDEAGPGGGDPAPGAARRELAASAYRYDGVGNRVQVTEDRLVARPPTPGGGKAAIHARERVDLGEQSRVEGDVLVDETRDHGWCRFGHGRRCQGHGPGGHDRGHGLRRGQESSATLDDRAVVQGDVVAERVELRRQARVEGDVETDDLRRGQGSVVTGAVSAYAIPDPAVADVARVNPGHTDFTSRLNQVVTLQPGRYDDVKMLAGSRLILPGGTYELSTLHLGLGVVVEVRGPVVLRVASTLQLLHGTKVQPAAGLTTAQVRWETTDRNVLVGNDVQFFGELAAPEARVDVGRDARIRGAIEAERVVVGDCAQVIGPPSGPGSPGGVDRVQRLVTYGVNSLNQYTSVGGVARSHDRSGNLVDDGVRRLTWDYRNRLVAVADKASGRPIAAYAYDSGNRRVGKATYTAAGGVDRVTRSFWDGWDLVEEQSASGTTEVTYVSGVGVDEHLQVVRTSASPLGAAVLWCAQDARGDVVAVTNAGGALVERAKFDDFGRQTGGGSQPHGFQGRYRDSETGWVYFRNRFYDPETGRFLGRDPVWDPRNVGNLYTFCGNGPGSRDPLGLTLEDGFVNFFGIGDRDSTAVAALSGAWEGLSETFGDGKNPFRQQYVAEQRRLDQAVDLFGDRGDSFGEMAAGTVGVLISDGTGGTELYEATSGKDTTKFVETGNMHELSGWERVKRGGIGALKAVGVVAQVSSVRVGLQGLRGGAAAAEAGASSTAAGSQTSLARSPLGGQVGKTDVKFALKPFEGRLSFLTRRLGIYQAELEAGSAKVAQHLQGADRVATEAHEVFHLWFAKNAPTVASLKTQLPTFAGGPLRYAEEVTARNVGAFASGQYGSMVTAPLSAYGSLSAGEAAAAAGASAAVFGSGVALSELVD